MADTEPALDATPNPKSAGKSTTKKTAKPKKPTNHPKYSDMIKQALEGLKERGGSSRQAILKYIVKHFNVGKDEKTINQHLKMALRAGVRNGTLKQSKGTGASGSFKLGESKEGKKPRAKKDRERTKKPKAKKPKKAAAEKKKPKKPKKPKKTPEKKKAASVKVAAKPKKTPKPKSPKKPKAPKVKKPKAAKSKKTAAKKK